MSSLNSGEKMGEPKVTQVTSQSSGEILNYEGETVQPKVNELHRTFKARHIQMICLGGCIGSGIFVGTGKSLHQGGAAAMLIGYTIVCMMALAVMNVLTEITCIWPASGSFIEHANRFVDPAVAFATGFSEWFAWMTVVASEGAVVRIVLSYWIGDSFSTAACMTIYLFLVFFIHALPNRWFAEFEFVTAAFKVLAMFIILFVCIAMLAGAGPTGSTHHSYNWSEAPIFPHGFKGVCATFTLAAWATGGQEIMGLSAGEARRPRWDMPRACTNLFVRILFFYELSIIFISFLVPYNDHRLLSTGTIASSPFVIALEDAGIRGLPDFLNVVIILSLVAIGAESLYISSRVMTAMARMGFFPRILGRIDQKGRPRWALIATAICSTICTYINCSSTGGVIFGWFSSISATTYFMAWMVIAVTNIQMRRAISVQGDSAWSRPYAWKLRAWPLTSIFLFVSSLLVLIGTGYVALFPIGSDTPTAEGFFGTMLGVPVWIVAFLFWKLFRRTTIQRPEEVDLAKERMDLTPENIAEFDAYYSQTAWKRALSYVRF